MTLAAVAHVNNRNSRAAAAEAAETLRQGLAGQRPDVLIAFATAGYTQPELIGTLRAAFAGVPLCGCSAEGVLTTAGGSDEGSHALAVMALRSEAMRFSTLSVRDVGADSRRAGRALAAQVQRALADGAPASARVLRSAHCSIWRPRRRG